ncbi:hypothetical protein NliqN6_4039 [Naganishia liquefaciens]|uniref:Ubiquitin thioesterase OTU n=1 Tax=Naganishia liquefaciens TaxID=104408 RepID=A0A8H3TUY7_9TREE|nr:hypothetical protein NliqN6_4039 [Naganishia liquefaciens]
MSTSASFPVRLRHPRGVTTLAIEHDTTLEELQARVFSATEIPRDAQDLKYGYPPKPIPATTVKLSSIPITRGEQIIVTDRPPSQRPHTRSSPSAPTPSRTTDAPQDTPAANVFETAPTPKSTVSTATHTPTPAPSVPRTIIPSPYPSSAYPGTGPASTASTSGLPQAASTTTTTTTAPTGTTLAVPAGKPPLGSSPLAEKTPSHPPNPPTGGTGTFPAYPSTTQSSTPTSIPLADGAGTLVHRIVPDDNSCLFSAVGIVFRGGYDETVVKELREVVAEEIRKDPINYSDVILGRPREEYIDLITRPSTWGGAIELAVFAKHFKTEISSYDVMTGRADRFGEGEYDNRCILIYSGIHYDAATSSPTPDAPTDFHTSIFPTTDTHILVAARELVKRLKEKHYYTDTQNFDLRCQVCQIGLKGEQGAREHAIKTGHVEFGEY